MRYLHHQVYKELPDDVLKLFRKAHRMEPPLQLKESRLFVSSMAFKIASMCLQERIVKAMGYRVVQVPHWHWNKIRHRKQRIEYIRMSSTLGWGECGPNRYYALKDRRELVPRDEEVQDVAVNELDFMGEYFFRKDAPQTHFAWFQPRYDAKLRIPGASKASAGTLREDMDEWAGGGAQAAYETTAIEATGGTEKTGRTDASGDWITW
eukprot:symbB.v1.2.020445.t4/scaffold1723.1/size104661/1